MKSKEKILSLLWFKLGCSPVCAWIHGKLCQHYLQAWVLQLTAGREGLQTTSMKNINNMKIVSVFSPLTVIQASPEAALLETDSSGKGERGRQCRKRDLFVVLLNTGLPSVELQPSL